MRRAPRGYRDEAHKPRYGGDLAPHQSTWVHDHEAVDPSFAACAVRPPLPRGIGHLVLTVYTLGVLVVMLVPVPDTPTYVPGGFDKAVHVALFLGLGFLAYWDLRAARRPKLLPVVVAGVGLAALIELVQHLLPYRSGDAADLAAGAAGVMMGAWLAKLVFGARKRGDA